MHSDAYLILSKTRLRFAFANCGSLQELRVGKRLKQIREGAFKACGLTLR